MIHKSIILLLLLVAIAFAALWPKSFRNPKPRFFLAYTASAEIMFLCHNGSLRISHWTESTVVGSTKSVENSWMGFGYTVSIRDTPQGRSSRMHRFIFPMWFTAIVFVAYPIVALIRGVRRRLRQRHGYCRKCGYNLTGLPEPRCPECGTRFDGESTDEIHESSPSQAKT